MGAAVTDEPLDAYVNRPLATLLVHSVDATPVTPNHLTLASAACGTAAGVGFMLPSPHAHLAGAVALFFSMVLDCSDGQLARVRGGGSLVGRVLDGYADYWVAFALHLGILIGMFNATIDVLGHRVGPLETFLFVLTAGVSMAVNAGRFDRLKHLYIAHTSPSHVLEVPGPYVEAARHERSPVLRLGLRLFIMYLHAQRASDSPDAIAAARRTALDPIRRAAYVAEHARWLRLWSASGPTTHNAAMCLFASASFYLPLSMAAYCLFAIVGMNLYCASVGLLHRRAEAHARARGAALEGPR